MTTLNTTQIDLVAALVNVALDRMNWVDHATYCDPVAIQARQMIDYAVAVLRLHGCVSREDHGEACEVYLRCVGHRNVQAA